MALLCGVSPAQPVTFDWATVGNPGNADDTHGAGYGAVDYAYRISKAAVNMVMATLARELEPQGIVVAALNPGWVKTDMGGVEAELTVERSIRSLREVIAGLTTQQSSAFLNYDGTTIPW